ncbi:MAG TPA: CsbD family protein [Candidatus Sulfomarinibacteraceae bacterium]|nr:CsbD family protein [Candidatus Sulfomarinibacteraceae bacterium]
MNDDVLKGKWKQLKGRIREEWGELTDDDIDRIQGNREQLEGRLQERYGYAKDEARDEVDNWLERMTD